MNGVTIIDTDILIDAAHQISEAVECLIQIERQSVLAVSVITQMGNRYLPRRFRLSIARWRTTSIQTATTMTAPMTTVCQ